MSTIETHLPAGALHDHGDNHDPHLAHHFDTVEQQFQSAKLGMWTFLGTEILMFGGLFCAYSVYRHNHPDVFAVAHEALNRWLGAVNTIVLITSSLTMAWGVRASQLGNQAVLRWLLAATIIGGFGFLGIKAIEYHTKWEHKLGFGSPKVNTYYGWDGSKAVTGYFEEEAEHAEGAASNEHGDEGKAAGETTQSAPANTSSAAPITELPPGAAIDGNIGTSDQAQIVANFADPKGVVAKYGTQHAESPLTIQALSLGDKKSVYTFFAVYFFMTGLHGLHVVIGMSLIYWILLRASGPRRKRWLIPAAPISVGLFITYCGIIIGGPFWGTFLIALGVAIAIDGAIWAALWGRFSGPVPQPLRWLVPLAQVILGAVLVVAGCFFGWTFTGMFLIVFGILLGLIGLVWALAWLMFDAHQPEEGEFGPDYFTPVDLVGLYWHVVDLIWIFLFPMLYLIH